MEQEPQQPNYLTSRRLAAALAMSAVALVPVLDAHHVEAEANSYTQVDRQDQKKDEWKLVWRDNFDGNQLSDRWHIIGPRTDRGSKFEQYRISTRNVKVGGGKVTVRSERECDGVPSVAPCAASATETYTSGRFEEKIRSIEGDFKIVVKAKAPPVIDPKTGKLQRGFRREGWGKNGDNVCIEGKTNYAEFDMFELFNGDFTTSNRIVYCDNGDFISAPRKEKYDDGWSGEVHEFVVERTGANMEFFVDDDPVQLLSNPNRSKDRRSDYPGATREEFDEGYLDPFGMIFSNTVFVEPGRGNFQPADSSKNFVPPRLIIYKVEQYSKQ